MHRNFRINKVGKISECSCEQLKREVLFLKNCLRNCEVENELIQPSKNVEIIRPLIESNIKVIDNYYEISVVMMEDVINILPYNFNYASEHIALLRSQALKKSKMKRTSIKTFSELISAGWLAHIASALIKNSCSYLPFFITKQKKPGVVFDGVASYKGFLLNDVVLPWN